MPRRIALSFAMAVTCAGSPALADTYYVPGDYGTIQAAWDAIPGSGGPGWFIVVAPGTYLENLDLSGKTAWIIGNGNSADQVVVDSSTSPDVVPTIYVENAPFDGGPFLERSTITGGAGNPGGFFTYGGGVYLAPTGEIRLDNCVVRNNSAFYGGGIYAGPGATLTLYDTVVEENSGALGGGITAADYVYIDDSTLRNNTASSGGNLLLFADPQSAVVQNTAIEGGEATGDDKSSTGGGVLLIDHAQATFRNCTFTGNSAPTNGGAIAVATVGPPTISTQLNIDGCTFTNNSAGWVGGAIDFTHPGTLQVEDTDFIGNTASRGGGAVKVATGQATFEDGCTFTGNAIAPDTGTGFRNGGAIFALEALSLTISDSVISGNTALIYGGGIYLNDTEADLNNVVFNVNVANSRGEAIYATAFSSLSMDLCQVINHADRTALYASLTHIDIDRSLFQNNGQGFNGGGAIDLFNSDDSAGQSRINSCSFIDNWSGDSGGAIHADDWNLLISACYFDYNYVEGPNDWRGGAIFGQDSDLTISDCNFSYNYCNGDGGSVAVQNTTALSISGTEFEFGASSGEGGEVYVAANSAAASFTNCNFEGGYAGTDGGAIDNHAGGSTLDGCTITACYAEGTGGGVRASAWTPIANSTICGNDPDQVNGNWADNGGNLISASCNSCPADLNNDGQVNGADLGLMIGAWGACAGDPCLGDINLDGVVDGADLGLLIGAWGVCP
ncbi:MAG: hypothetical protein MK085_03650 [Phycisphaerales bacterium]|nr:hypothetical protein [Phycisphaerales bacterium]